MKLNEYLIFLREKRGLSLEVLAGRLHYSITTIRCVEQGKMITPTVLSAYNRYFRRDIPDELELYCQDCGKQFVSINGLMLFCPECSEKVKPCGRGFIKKKVHKYNPNPVTADTVMIICMYHLEGQTVKQIGKLLNRPPELVARLLRRAIRNGTYETYRYTKENAPRDFANSKPTFAFYKFRKKLSIQEDNDD